MPPIRGVVLDVMGTLVPLTGVQHRLVQRGVPADAAERDGMAATLGGTCPSMREVGAHHVQALSTGFALADDVAAEVLDGAADELADGAGPALCELAQAGLLLGTLTNGSHKTSLAALERAGLPRGAVHDELQLEVGSWAAVRSGNLTTQQAAGAHAWKPHANAYRYMTTVWSERKGVMPEQLLFVTAHPWDAHGAASSGLCTCLVGEIASFFKQPTFVVASFHELADLVLRNNKEA